MLFVALSIFGAVMIPHTKINYDLTGYLPAHCDSSTALELLKKEFDDKGMAYVMVKDVTPEKAGEIKTRLEKVEGVALKQYVGAQSVQYGLFAAGAIIVSVPIMALFFALQKHLVGGLTAGGVKG